MYGINQVEELSRYVASGYCTITVVLWKDEAHFKVHEQITTKATTVKNAKMEVNAKNQSLMHIVIVLPDMVDTYVKLVSIAHIFYYIKVILIKIHVRI